MNRRDQDKLRPIAAKAREQVLREYANDPNVLGGGFGRRWRDGKLTDTPALVVYVEKKIGGSLLPDAAKLPNEIRIDGHLLAVDVVETGQFKPQAYLLRERPARWGCSVSHYALGGYGTLGAVIYYQPNGRFGILSNNHVLALATDRNDDDTSLGLPQKFDAVVQPGGSGNTVLDTIAWVECWVPLRFQGNGSNRVDAALAYEDPGGMLINEAMGGWPVVTPSIPAVGLLFAGTDQVRTALNRMTEVLTLLPFNFLPNGHGSMTVNAYVGQTVQKTGASTEHTVGEVLEVDSSFSVGPYRGGRFADFTGQIVTTPMSARGDSGSVTMEGGDRSQITYPLTGPLPIYLSCPTVLAVELVLGVPVTQDDPELREARDKYLRQTLVGRFLVDTFYKNEETFRSRVQEAEVGTADKQLAQALYTKHVGDLKFSLANPGAGGGLSDDSLVDLAVAARALAKYQSADEQRAVDTMLEIAREAEGKTLDEVLVMLNDKRLLARVKAALGNVKSIDLD